MADYVDYTEQQFGSFIVQRLADVTDVYRRQNKTQKITEWQPCLRYPNATECVFIGRNKYWYCVCCACNAVDIIRSDHLSEKKCRCQKKNP